MSISIVHKQRRMISVCGGKLLVSIAEATGALMYQKTKMHISSVENTKIVAPDGVQFKNTIPHQPQP
jgi:hypothetical protein